MVSRSASAQIPLSISECNKIMEDAGIKLDHKLKERKENYIKWKVGGPFDLKKNVNYTLETALSPIHNDRTELKATASAFGLHDGLGILTDGANTFIRVFQNISGVFTLKCPKCSKPVLPDALFCMNDGEAVRKKCVKCGAVNAIDAQFCTKCGNKF